jgi:hypothetical protein
MERIVATMNFFVEIKTCSDFVIFSYNYQNLVVSELPGWLILHSRSKSQSSLQGQFRVSFLPGFISQKEKNLHYQKEA